jgi:NAD(P)H-dependent flavin oxidoreductase YrpB (nitropropane dioxygenase family)
MAIARQLRRPIIGAPMAGGPSTPALAAAVSQAGGLGFLAAGMISTERLVDDVHETLRLTDRPFGVNVFLPGKGVPDQLAVAAYRQSLADEAERWGVALGEPGRGDDDYRAKLDALLAEPVAVVSFAFNLPDGPTVAALQRAGSEVWVTVNHPDAATAADELGVDALVVQGTEAGGHRGGALDDADYGVLPLLRLAAGRTGKPLVAAGGIADGAALAAVLAAGATAAQIGTALLRCPEAGTSAVHRAAVAGSVDTALTRAFTGRRARAVVNDFLLQHERDAPAAYPAVLDMTRPVLAAARAAGDAGTANLWAGQAHELAREIPAGQVVQELTAEAFGALVALVERAHGWQE